MVYQFSTIVVCPICRRNPLVFTDDFRRPFASFCTECKLFLGKGHIKRITVTEDLKKKLRSNSKIFNAAADDYINPGYRKPGCKKCEAAEGTSDFHVAHLSTKEHVDNVKAKYILGI